MSPVHPQAGSRQACHTVCRVDTQCGAVDTQCGAAVRRLCFPGACTVGACRWWGKVVGGNTQPWTVAVWGVLCLCPVLYRCLHVLSCLLQALLAVALLFWIIIRLGSLPECMQAAWVLLHCCRGVRWCCVCGAQVSSGSTPSSCLSLFLSGLVLHRSCVSVSVGEYCLLLRRCLAFCPRLNPLLLCTCQAVPVPKCRQCHRHG
jgi:hypothetical protein